MTAERPEHDLLRLSVRRRLTITDSASIHELFQGDLDWKYLLDTASRHHVLPLLAETIRAMGNRRIPPTALAAIAARVHTIHARNRQLAFELIRLHRLATIATIQFLSFKGPLLATAIYGDLGLRQFGDLDILIDAASSPKTEAFLATLGYRRGHDFGYEVTFVNDHLGVAVDLHRALSPDNFPVLLSFPRLWARRAVVALEGARLETLAPSDLLIAACIEAVKDARLGKVKLGKISDIAHLSVSDIDWTDVEVQARRLGLRRVLSFGIGLVADVLRLPIAAPPALLARHPRLTKFHREAQTVLFAAADGQRPSSFRGACFHFHVRESWRDKLRPYVWRARRLVTPNALDRDVIVLPTWLSPLYYFVRPLRLAHLYGRRLVKRIARS